MPSVYRAKDEPDLELEPDLNDPNRYCKVCETTYPTALLFKKHLRTIYFIVVKMARTYTTTPIHSIIRERPEVLPDPQDPNNFCRVCHETYLVKQRYFRHLLKYHGMKASARIRRFDILPDLFDVDYYCRACEHKLASKCNRSYASDESLLKHVRLVHDILEAQRQKPSVEGPMPDVHDPNFYCRVCDKTLSTKKSFSSHLNLIHDVFIPRKLNPVPIGKLRRKPCNLPFTCRSTYRGHLRFVHKVTIVVDEDFAHDPDFLPDIDDPKFYCRACGKVKESLKDYRKHCKNIHMKLKPITKAKKSRKRPPPKLSGFDCTTCRKRMNTKAKNLFHMRTVHRLNALSRIKKPKP
ncbi:hypothetical protein [Parasitella parasitica]|uniref:C2H2-type domain-containing protein n=1 Tax=Parasitella parasitica TaxID=35722 RepID=A0A0B7NBW6_9FUNG|nr:hypothetical protein [Parasitella parasitica]